MSFDDKNLQIILKLENRTALHAVLKKKINIIIFSYFTLDETDKKYELIFFKMRQPYKKQKKLLASNTNKETTQDKE